MSKLMIETAENGFIVYDNSQEHMRGRQWAFESAASLAKFIGEWGHNNTKCTTEATSAGEVQVDAFKDDQG